MVDYKITASYMGRKISFNYTAHSLSDALKDGEIEAKKIFRDAGYILLAWANESKIDIKESKK